MQQIKNKRKGMETMIKNRAFYGGLLLTASVFFAGCSNAIPEMDEDTKALVVEYAAGIVEKYDQNYVVKLKEVSETEDVILPAEETAEASDADSFASAPETNIPDTENGDVYDESFAQEAEKTIPESLEEFLQTEGVSFRYEGYETTSFYPNNGEELYFVMNATEGSKLLVLHFTVRNDSQEEKQIDLIHSGTRFKIEVNGEMKNALTTMLLNDMCNYQNTLAAGESDSLVLVCEIPEEQSDSILSLSLTMKNAEKIASIQLN